MQRHLVDSTPNQQEKNTEQRLECRRTGKKNGGRERKTVDGKRKTVDGNRKTVESGREGLERGKGESRGIERGQMRRSMFLGGEWKLEIIPENLGFHNGK